MPDVYNPYVDRDHPTYAMPKAGGGPRNAAMRQSAKAVQALAAGVIGKAARAAFAEKKRTAAKASQRNANRYKAAAADQRARASNSVAYKRGPYKKTGSKYERRFPQVLKQRYYLTDAVNYKAISAPGGAAGQVQGTVVNQTALYSADSKDVKSASVVVLAVNNTEAHWNPQTANTGQVGPYRTGIQLCGGTPWSCFYGVWHSHQRLYDLDAECNQYRSLVSSLPYVAVGRQRDGRRLYYRSWHPAVHYS